MIIFRDAETEARACGIASVFDRNGLCVVSMTLTKKGVWLIVGQDAQIDFEQIDAEIVALEAGEQKLSYTEERPDPNKPERSDGKS